jgi:lysophospholipase L1-like esterase
MFNIVKINKINIKDMKRYFSILIFTALLLTGCNDKKVVLNSVPEPSWYTNENYFKEKNSIYNEMPIDIESIVMFGDDIIDRGEWESFYNNSKIKNRGIALEGTEHTMYRVDTIASKHPAEIFLSTGMRDVKHGAKVDSTIERILMIIERIQKISPDTKLYYLGIVPDGTMTEKEISETNKINSAIAESSKKGAFIYVDIPALLIGEKGVLSENYSWNGVNLNGAGYEVVAKAIEKYVGNTALNKANDREYAEITDYYKHRVSIFNSLPETTGKFIMLGNSLNNNCPWTELLPLSPVINRGISGDVIEGVYNRLDDIVEENPRKIFLMIGINDFINKSDLTVSSAWKSYEKLIKKIKKELPDTDLYIQSTLPLNPKSKYYKGINAKVEELNKLLQADEEKYGYIYIDISKSLKDKKGDLDEQYTYDGIHLNVDGYFMWAAHLMNSGYLINPLSNIK